MPDEPNPSNEAIAIPSTAVDAEPEQVREVFHEILGIKNRFRKLRSFFRTRKQIRSGAYLFDNSADELRSRGLMGPLTFNIYGSTLAGAFALALSKAVGFLFPPPSDAFSRLTPLNAVSAQYLKLVPLIDSYLQPFVVPIVFLLIAFCVSWGTIRGSEPTVTSISSGSIDWSRPSRARGRNAFLYFDGAYGFIPQAIMASTFVIVKSLTANIDKSLTGARVFPNQYPAESPEFQLNPIFAAVALATFGVLAVTVLYSGYLTYYRFPKLLFKAHGYYKQKQEAEGNAGSPRPPWGKYILTALFIIPIVSTLTYLVFAGVVIVLARFFAVVITVANGTFSS